MPTRCLFTPQFSHQRGIALLTALMVMAVAVMIATAVISTQHYEVRIQSNIQQLERAYQYASGIEQMAGIWLSRDLTLNQTDSLQDVWSNPLPELPIKAGDTVIGNFSGKLEDASAYFNLNNLLGDNNEVSESDVKLFKQLLIQHQLPEGLSNTLLDWMDADNQTRSPDSAETDYYTFQVAPHLAANRSLTDASELYMLRLDHSDTDDKVRQKQRALLEHTVALPKPTKININTAPAALLEVLLPSEAATIIAQRQQQPLDANALTLIINRLKVNQPLIPQPPDNATESNISSNGSNNKDSLSVEEKTLPKPKDWDAILDNRSHYFRLQGQVNIGNVRLNLNSLLERTDSGKIYILMRRFEYTNQAQYQKS